MSLNPSVCIFRQSRPPEVAVLGVKWVSHRVNQPHRVAQIVSEHQHEHEVQHWRSEDAVVLRRAHLGYSQRWGMGSVLVRVTRAVPKGLDEQKGARHEMNETPVVGLWEAGFIRVVDRSYELVGASARVFRRGSEPYDVQPGSTLVELA